MIAIIPSLLVQNEAQFLTQIQGLGLAVTQVQIDIADGIFVSQTTWADPSVIKNHLQVDCELHLMVADPLKILTSWRQVSQVQRILVHLESVPNLIAILPKLRAYGWAISLVLNPETPVSALDPYLDSITGVMFMGVHPGRQAQAFIPETLDKIREFKRKKTTHFVEIDGGVNLTTLPGIIAAGVDGICPGSAIFGNNKSPKENVEEMRKKIASLTNE